MKPRLRGCGRQRHEGRGSKLNVELPAGEKDRVIRVCVNEQKNIKRKSDTSVRA